MQQQESRGVILFNKGDKCTVRALVALHSLRKWWNGNVTMFLEEPYPQEFETACKHFNVNIVKNKQNNNFSVLVRKTQTFINAPYDRNLWLDADTVVLGPIDEMFDYLDNGIEVAIPHFAGWWADGRTLSKRINNYKNIASKELLEEATKHHPAINTGILSYRKNTQFLKDWIALAEKGNGKMFIPDEVAFQVLYPSYKNIFIAPMKFNVSVKHDPNTEDKRILHCHGQKHIMDFPLCNIWKKEFNEMREKNIANINHFVEHYPDKRLKRYLKTGSADSGGHKVTVVTACDAKYVEFLRLTFPNWIKYKNINKYPIIVFVHGLKLEDPKLDFLRQYNVRLIQWDMPEIQDHREKMLSAFVFGTAEYVNTEFWLKIDADSYATDNRPIIDESMYQYAFCGHKWGYSKPSHIEELDKWASSHWRGKLKNATPMIKEGRIEGRRFYHNSKRTISFIQLHKTKFTKFCVSLLKTRRLPVPSQDTYMYFVCNRFDPQFVGVKNFKKQYGFSQGNSRLGPDALMKRLEEVEKNPLRMSYDANNANPQCSDEEDYENDLKEVQDDPVDVSEDPIVNIESKEIEESQIIFQIKQINK